MSAVLGGVLLFDTVPAGLGGVRGVTIVGVSRNSQRSVSTLTHEHQLPSSLPAWTIYRLLLCTQYEALTVLRAYCVRTALALCDLASTCQYARSSWSGFSYGL